MVKFKLMMPVVQFDVNGVLFNIFLILQRKIKILQVLHNTSVTGIFCYENRLLLNSLQKQSMAREQKRNQYSSRKIG